MEQELSDITYKKNIKRKIIRPHLSPSEPDSFEQKPANCFNRFHKFPHEYICIDDLKIYRRRNPTEFHPRSNYSLYYKSEPSIPFASEKSEYKQKFNQLILSPRPKAIHHKPCLRLDGNMNLVSEQRSKYLEYTPSEIQQSRSKLYHSVENLKLSGEVKENASQTSFHDKMQNIKNTKEMGGSKSNFKVVPALNNQPLDNSKPKYASQNCHLKLEGELFYVPEYRSQYVKYPIARSKSIPQICNIRFTGDFKTVPEYRDSFKSYENVKKNEPILKHDHLSLRGIIKAVPEYKEQFKEHHSRFLSRRKSLKSNDNLRINGKFTDQLPEYYESFKDPELKHFPARAKPRTPFLKLQGTIEYKPEYSSHYQDFPRTRPTVKKPTSSMKNNMKYKRTPSPGRRFERNLSHNIHDPNLYDLPFELQPEYRRAKADLLIRRRPLDRTESIIAIVEKPTSSVSNSSVELLNKPTITEMQSTSPPRYKLLVENVDDNGGSFAKKSTPKYGRRSSQQYSKVNRNQSKVIEGNPEYVKNTSIDNYSSPPEIEEKVIPDPIENIPPEEKPTRRRRNSNWQIPLS